MRGDHDFDSHSTKHAISKTSVVLALGVTGLGAGRGIREASSGSGFPTRWTRERHRARTEDLRAGADCTGAWSRLQVVRRHDTPDAAIPDRGGRDPPRRCRDTPAGWSGPPSQVSRYRTGAVGTPLAGAAIPDRGGRDRAGRYSDTPAGPWDRPRTQPGSAAASCWGASSSGASSVAAVLRLLLPWAR